MRQLLLIIAIILLIFTGVGIGMAEGSKSSSTMMPFIIAAFVISMVIWVYLTLTAHSWLGRLGGYIVIAVGCVILYFFLKATL